MFELARCKELVHSVQKRIITCIRRTVSADVCHWIHFAKQMKNRRIYVLCSFGYKHSTEVVRAVSTQRRHLFLIKLEVNILLPRELNDWLNGAK